MRPFSRQTQIPDSLQHITIHSTHSDTFDKHVMLPCLSLNWVYFYILLVKWAHNYFCFLLSHFYFSQRQNLWCIWNIISLNVATKRSVILYVTCVYCYTPLLSPLLVLLLLTGYGRVGPGTYWCKQKENRKETKRAPDGTHSVVGAYMSDQRSSISWHPLRRASLYDPSSVRQ